jgi:hypothetical protein
LLILGVADNRVVDAVDSGVGAGAERWRDRPRLSLWNWRASHLSNFWARRGDLFVILVVGLWLAGALAVWGAVTGDKDAPAGDSRVLNGLVAAIAIASAVLLTRLAWQFLSRPVVDREKYEDAERKRRAAR